MRRFIETLTVALCCVLYSFAQGPNGSGSYYKNADGKSGQELKTALFSIISKGTVKRTYKQLWTDFKSTDKRSDGKVWDMYSNITNYVFGDDQDTGKEGKRATITTASTRSLTAGGEA